MKNEKLNYDEREFELIVAAKTDVIINDFIKTLNSLDNDDKKLVTDLIYDLSNVKGIDVSRLIKKIETR
ncbi:hypothetical protein HXX01_03450 [Candidatus Nomurabacteria bacterium]|nr:hypothetical protein [Candidatus Nomurabacteria bacterium]